MKTIDLPPYAPTLMESTRAIGYSIESAIADVIDNSITANSTLIEIDFFPIDAFISILDNGIGMSEEELIAAMQYGSKSPLDERETDDLGRYGLGMKTASLSQCRILTVVSKKSGKLSACRWDLNHILNAKSWSLIVLNASMIGQLPNIDKLHNLASGTLVIWQDLDKFSIGERNIEEAYNKKMGLVREHLSLVFHRFLSGEQGIRKLSIKMNNSELAAHDPFLINKSTLLMDQEVITINDAKVTYKPYILPHISQLTKEEINSLSGKEGLRKSQGFYVYRNKRLLIWGTWFRLLRQGDLSKLARVQVDIPNSLDDLWTLDIKKSTATPPEEVRKNLSIVIDKIAEGSKRTWTYRGRKERNTKITPIWNRLVTRDNGVIYEVNINHPLINIIQVDHPEIFPQVQFLLKQIGLSLPLNSLYLDLTSDEKLNEDTDISFDNIIQLITLILKGKNKIEIDKLIETLKYTDPFNNYIDEIDEAMSKGEFYG